MSEKLEDKKQSVILIILDGWGIAPPNKGNAIDLAQTPFFDSLLKKYYILNFALMVNVLVYLKVNQVIQKPVI